MTRSGAHLLRIEVIVETYAGGSTYLRAISIVPEPTTSPITLATTLCFIASRSRYQLPYSGFLVSIPTIFPSKNFAISGVSRYVQGSSGQHLRRC